MLTRANLRSAQRRHNACRLDLVFFQVCLRVGLWNDLSHQEWVFAWQGGLSDWRVVQFHEVSPGHDVVPDKLRFIVAHVASTL